MLTLQTRTLIISLAMLAAACKDKATDDPLPTTPTALTVQTVSNLDADTTTGHDPVTGAPTGTTGHFTLYSLADGRRIATADSASTKWDIGFRGTTLILNGGSSGPGQAGAAVLTGVFADIDSLQIAAGRITGATKAAVFTPFEQDSAGGSSPYAIRTGSGRGWYNYADGLITAAPGRVIALRTATGKFAKLEIISYYRNAPASPVATDASRFYTFRYTYQPDGTTRVR